MIDGMVLVRGVHAHGPMAGVVHRCGFDVSKFAGAGGKTGAEVVGAMSERYSFRPWLLVIFLLAACAVVLVEQVWELVDRFRGKR